MKKSINTWLIVIGVILVLVIAGLIYFAVVNSNKVDISTDSKKFEEEYESLNDEQNNDGKDYLNLDIPSDNPIKYSSYEEVFDILDNGSGVIYFGFPECPCCRNLAPVLMDAAYEVGIETIFYLNALNDRDIKSLDEDGNIVVDKEGTDNYYQLVDKLNEVLGEYKGLNDDSIKRLYFPTVIFVVEGEIVDINIGTVDSQTDPYVELTSEEKTELKDKLMEGMQEIISCTDAC